MALGPLTNLAVAVRLDPRIAREVREVVIMGGAAFVGGNVSPVAEANFYNDPEAAAIVLEAGWPVTVIGLDVTVQVLLPEATLAALEGSSDPIAAFLRRILPFYFGFHRAFYGIPAIHVHDPTAMAYVLAPDRFRTESFPVGIAREGPATGRLIVDRLRRFYKGAVVSIATAVDAAGVLALLTERLFPPSATRGS